MIGLPVASVLGFKSKLDKLLRMCFLLTLTNLSVYWLPCRKKTQFWLVRKWFCDGFLWEFLPPANEVWGRVMFLHVCVILLGSMHHRLPDQPLGGVCLHGGGGGLPPRGSASTEFCFWGSASRGLHLGLHQRGWADPPNTRNRKVGRAHPTEMLSCYLKVQSEFSVQSTTKNFLTDQWRIQGGRPRRAPPYGPKFS